MRFERVRGDAMKSVYISNQAAAELAKAERLVVVTNALIELQREFLEHLNDAGVDITSAKNDFETLSIRLASCVWHRHRIRSLLNVKRVEASAA